MDTQQIELSVLASKVFTPGSPINEKDFFMGRLKQLRQLIDAITYVGQHAILYGEPGAGKTSLANTCKEFLQETILVARANCVFTDTYSSIWDKIFSTISYPKTTHSIGFRSEPKVETGIITEILTKKDNNGNVIVTSNDVLSILRLLSIHIRVLVIIDEVDRLQDQNVRRELADTIKMLSDHQVNVTLLLVGVADSVDDLIKEHRSIERAIIQIHLPRMEPKELEEILNKGISKLALKINLDVVKEIVTLSKGLPYFVHLLGLNICRYAIDQGAPLIKSDHLSEAIKIALENSHQTIKSSYYKATSTVKHNTIHKHVLLSCALAKTDEFGFFNAASIAAHLSQICHKKYSIPNYARHLKDFSESKRGEILQRVGDSHNRLYRFSNPMMQPFVIMRGISDGLITKEDLKSSN